MRSWLPWPTDDYKNLARYVVPEAAAAEARIDFSGINRNDLLQNKPDGWQQLAQHLYDGLKGREPAIRYAINPFQFHDRQQQIRTPAEILTHPGEGTCLDLALLYASLCLESGLIPVVVLLDGSETSQHVLTCVSLEKLRQDWHGHQNGFQNDGLVQDESALRKAVARGRYLAIECTGFAHTTNNSAAPELENRDDGFLPFATALRAGQQLVESYELLAALDIARLQIDRGYDPYILSEEEMNATELAELIMNGIVEHPRSEEIFTRMATALQASALGAPLLQALWADKSTIRQIGPMLQEPIVEALGNDTRLHADMEAMLTPSGSPGSFTVTNSGDNAQIAGPGATVVGAGGVNVGGNVGGSIVTGSNNTIGGNRTTVGGDMVQGDKVGGDKITVGDIQGTGIAIGKGATAQIRRGDTFNMSGDFRGAILNLNATLDNVSQTIAGMSTDDQATRDELSLLVANLREELNKLPAEHVEKAEAVVQTTEAVVQQTAAAKPNRTMLNITAEGLKQAAANIAGVMPKVVEIAAGIVAAAWKIVG